MFEQFYICPSCATKVSILVDTSINNQDFIEDCELCCRPIRFQIKVEEGEISQFDYKLVEQ